MSKSTDAVIVFFYFIGFFIVLIALSMKNSDKSDKPVTTEKYREEHYTMIDGTECIILKGGTHAGMIGLTCNYKEE